MDELEEIDIKHPSERRDSRRNDAKIEDHLEKGSEILVQVTKEPIGKKGPRVTGQISLPGRFLVFMPGLHRMGVSRKIEERSERIRLKELMSELKPKAGGLIVRTAGEGKGKNQFEMDLKYLARLWRRVDRKRARVDAPSLVHQEMGLATSLARDVFVEEVSRLVIDSKQGYKQVVSYLKSVAPELSSRVHYYDGSEPLFDVNGIEREIEKAMDRRIRLKRGGYIVIDHTEALVSIDVNTGRYTGRRDQEETILRTNLEAAREVARQLRLRDIGGIIVIDFIDMENDSNKKAVVEELRSRLRTDRSRTKTFRVSELGLVEMTRQRVRPSLLDYFSQNCPTCMGLGKVLSFESIYMRFERAVRRLANSKRERNWEIRMSPELAVYMLEEQGARLAQLEKAMRLRLDIRDDPRLRREEILFRSHRGDKVVEEIRA
jgi:ribonuclease G